MFLETLILGINIQYWIVMFVAMFVGVFFVVWKPFTDRNTKLVRECREPLEFFKGYLYLFLVNAFVVLSVMLLAMDQITAWGIDVSSSPTIATLIGVGVASFVFVVIMQDSIKVVIDEYLKKNKPISEVAKDCAEEIKKFEID